MKMRTLMDLVEAPLADFQVHGDLDQADGSFSKSDRTYMGKALLKGVYRKKLQAIPFNLYVYVLNAAGLDVYGREFPEGDFDSAIRGNIEPEHRHLFDSVVQAIDINRAKDPSAIHFVLGDNHSTEGQVPPTPWIVVHRMLHCFDLKEFAKVEKAMRRGIVDARGPRSSGMISDNEYAPFFTMRSAMSERLENGELGAELATQFVMTGDIPTRNLATVFEPQEIAAIEAALKNYKHDIELGIGKLAGKALYI